MSYDPLTDQKQEGATAKQTKLSPDLLGGLFLLHLVLLSKQGMGCSGDLSL